MNNFMDIAIREAKKSPSSWNHGAVVIDSRGNFLSKGYNSGYHAEINALLKVPTRLRKGTTVYSVRLSSAYTKINMAKPCQNCQKVLRKYGVNKVYYSSTDGSLKKLIL